jgi:hypothetical protein
MNKKKSKEEEVRQRIGTFMEKNPEMKPQEIAKHYELEGISQRTTFSIINRLKNGGTIERKPGSGQYQSIDQKIKDKVIEFSVNEVGLSYIAIGRKFGIDPKTAKKILIEAGIDRLKRKECPKSSEKQIIKQKKCLNKLRRKHFTNGVEIIMDDESYFTTDGSDTNYNDFYYSHPCLEVPDEVKFRPKSKFPKKVMVWIAMSAKGFSQPFIMNSGNSVNSDIYIRECLTKLKDFIEQKHSDENYIFWPDLATAHYSGITQQIYESVGIKVVPKESNPPNVPQVRPIERFWAYLGKKLYENGWTTDSVPKLKKRIKKIIREVPQDLCQNLMKGVKTKVRKAADRGALSVIN